MNIITKADVKKFLMLLKAGIKEGKQKELKTYTSAGNVIAGVPLAYYVSLELRFTVDRATVEALFLEEDADLQNDIDNLLNSL